MTVLVVMREWILARTSVDDMVGAAAEKGRKEEKNRRRLTFVALRQSGSAISDGNCDVTKHFYNVWNILEGNKLTSWCGKATEAKGNQFDQTDHVISGCFSNFFFSTSLGRCVDARRHAPDWFQPSGRITQSLCCCAAAVASCTCPQ